MDSGLPVEVITLASKLSMQSITSSTFREFSVQECSEMEWKDNLFSSLQNSVADDQSKPQGFVVEDIPLSKQPVISLYGGMKDGNPLSGVMEDGKSTTVPPIPPILPNSDSTPRNSSNHKKWGGFGYSGDNLKLLHSEETTERFTEYIKKAPECTVDLNEAANDLGVPLDDIRISRCFLRATCAVVNVEPNKVRWVHGNPAEQEQQRLRNRVMVIRFENVVKSMSSEKYANEYKWRWLFLTEGDINNCVGFQNDILMIVHCPRDINFEIPRPAQDGVGVGIDKQQRRYGIVRIGTDGKGMNCYFVSKLESHDVVNLDETSSSSSGSGGSSEQGLFPAERVWSRFKIFV